MACSPVTGSVTLALFTSQPVWVELAPLIFISPSGPRNTPGTNGSASRKRSEASGAFS